MKKLAVVGLVVRDYDEAIRFYTDKLGFTVSEDVTLGEDRWVVLSGAWCSMASRRANRGAQGSFSRICMATRST